MMEHENENKPCKHCFYAMEIIEKYYDECGRTVLVMQCVECKRILKSYEG